MNELYRLALAMRERRQSGRPPEQILAPVQYAATSSPAGLQVPQAAADSAQQERGFTEWRKVLGDVLVPGSPSPTPVSPDHIPGFTTWMNALKPEEPSSGSSSVTPEISTPDFPPDQPQSPESVPGFTKWFAALRPGPESGGTHDEDAPAQKTDAGPAAEPKR